MLERGLNSWDGISPAKTCETTTYVSSASPRSAQSPCIVMHIGKAEQHDGALQRTKAHDNVQTLYGCRACYPSGPEREKVGSEPHIIIFWWSSRVNCSKMSLSEMPKTRTAPT